MTLRTDPAIIVSVRARDLNTDLNNTEVIKMVVDIILDRKDGFTYSIDEFADLYDQATSFGFVELARAIDSGTEEDVKRELKNYIDEQGYNEEIKDYIDSVDWVRE